MAYMQSAESGTAQSGGPAVPVYLIRHVRTSGSLLPSKSGSSDISPLPSAQAPFFPCVPRAELTQN